MLHSAKRADGGGLIKAPGKSCVYRKSLLGRTPKYTKGSPVRFSEAGALAVCAMFSLTPR